MTFHQKNKTLLIVGMHRSGTSVIANWMHQCGLNLGEEMLGANISNAEGHYEDLDFLSLHEKLLEQHKLPGHGLISRSLGDLTEDETAQIKALVDKKNTLNKHWGWKEPRTCLFLAPYMDALPEAYYLIVTRGYRSVVSSLVMRVFKDSDKKYNQKGGLSKLVWVCFKKNWRKKKLLRKRASSYLKIWMHYNQQILEMVEKLPADRYLFTHQDVLLTHSASAFNWLQNHCGFSELQYIGFDKVYKKSLQSKVLNVDAYIDDPKLLEAAQALQLKLESMVQGQISSLDEPLGH